ncbi:hypothetical protein GQ600_12293 [Phytophthora cactorum]|nr:hypothetical protein GQ600_12293 [Phytophthora cactorum]
MVSSSGFCLDNLRILDVEFAVSGDQDTRPRSSRVQHFAPQLCVKRQRRCRSASEIFLRASRNFQVSASSTQYERSKRSIGDLDSGWKMPNASHSHESLPSSPRSDKSRTPDLLLPSCKAENSEPSWKLLSKLESKLNFVSFNVLIQLILDLHVRKYELELRHCIRLTGISGWHTAGYFLTTSKRGNPRSEMQQLVDPRDLTGHKTHVSLQTRTHVSNVALHAPVRPLGRPPHHNVGFENVKDAAAFSPLRQQCVLKHTCGYTASHTFAKAPTYTRPLNHIILYG